MDKINFEVPDIAAVLGRVCFANGRVSQFYSLAEHSVIVSLIMEEEKLGDPMEGLLHAGVLAHLPTAPVQFDLPDLLRVGKSLEEDLRDRFDLPPWRTEGLNDAVAIASHIAGRFLLADRGESQSDVRGMKVRALRMVEHEGWRVMNLTPTEATGAFLRRWDAPSP